MIYNKQIKVKKIIFLKIKNEKCFKTSKQRQNKTLLTSTIEKYFCIKNSCLTIVNIFGGHVNKIGFLNFNYVCIHRVNTHTVV